MTGIFNQNGQVNPWFNQQDGNGEQQPTAVYINRQDGNGEVKVWPGFIEDWNNGTGDWSLYSGGSLGTDSTDPANGYVSKSFSDTYGRITSSDGFNRAYTTAMTRGPGTKLESFYRQDTSAGEAQFGFAFQDNDNFYRVVIPYGSNDLIFQKDWDDGTNAGRETLGSATISVSASDWVQLQIDWQSNGTDFVVQGRNITSDGNWQSTGTVSDPETNVSAHGSGGFQWSGYNGNSNTQNTDFDALGEIDSLS